MTRRTITLTVDIDADHMLAHVADVLARTLAGLVLDGYGVQLDAATVEVDMEESTEVGDE